MSTEGSHAHLPASHVVAACGKTLAEIANARIEIKAAMAECKRRRGWLLPRRSFDEAFAMLTMEQIEIAQLHRVRDERVAGELLDLASAAAEDNPRFRIHVSANDFQVIKYHYGKEAT